MPVARVEAFARDLGVTLSASQRAKAEFVDGSITPPGTQVSNDGAISVKPSPFSLAALEARVQGELKIMAANGLVSGKGASEAATQIDVAPKAEHSGVVQLLRFRNLCADRAAVRVLRTNDLQHVVNLGHKPRATF